MNYSNNSLKEKTLKLTSINLHMRANWLKNMASKIAFAKRTDVRLLITWLWHWRRRRLLISPRKS